MDESTSASVSEAVNSREFPVNLGWRMLPGLIQIRQSNTGLFGRGKVTVSGRQIMIEGRKLWAMWLRILCLFGIGITIFLAVTLISGIAAYSGVLVENPNDSSLVGSVELALGEGSGIFLFIILPLLVGVIVAEVFLTKRAQLRCAVATGPKAGWTGKTAILDVVSDQAGGKRRRITLWFSGQTQCQEFIRMFDSHGS